MRTDRRSTPTLARRLPVLALAAALPLLALAGCGDGDEPTRTVAGDRVPEQREELPPPTPDVRELTVDTPASSGREPGPDRAEVDRPPLPEPVTYAAAESVYHEGDYLEAVRHFEAYVERRPDNPWGRYMLGLSAWKADRDGRAAEAFEAALERDPDHLKSLVNLSRVLLELERPEEARGSIDRALAVDPSSPDVLRVAGNVALELGETDRARTLYRRAVQADGRDAWSMNNLGLVLIHDGRFQEALPPLARAAELRPEEPVFRNNLGTALERTGHPGLASESYRIAAEAGHPTAGTSLERVTPHVPADGTGTLDLGALARRFVEQIEDRGPELAIEGRQELRDRRSGAADADSATAGEGVARAEDPPERDGAEPDVEDGSAPDSGEESDGGASGDDGEAGDGEAGGQTPSGRI